MNIHFRKLLPDSDGRPRWESIFRGRKKHHYEIWQGIKDDPDGWTAGSFHACRILPDGWKTNWDLQARTLKDMRELIRADAQTYE